MGKVNRPGPNKTKNSKRKKQSKPIKILDEVSLGDIEAEKDNNLSDYFVDSTLYHKVKDPKNSASIIVGEKGTGKSAILKKISLDLDEKKVLHISNNDLGILGMHTHLKEYLLDDAFKQRRLAFKFLWEFIICACVLQNYYKSKNWFDRKKVKYWDDEFKELNKFFNIERDDTPLKFSLTAAAKFLDPSNPFEYTVSVSKNSEKEQNTDLYSLIKTMNEFINNLDKYIPNEELFLLIDDLDSSWDNSEFAKLYTEGLVQAVFSINKKSKLKIAVTLLESVFNIIGLPNRDKIADNYAKNIRWDAESCNQLIIKRLVYNNLKINDIFTNDIKFDYIYKYTTGTPRDIIKFFQNCIEIQNEKKQKINKTELDIIINNFSELKLRELISQVREYFNCDITPIIKGLKGGKKSYNYKDFENKLNEICQLYDNTEILDHKVKNLLCYKGDNIKSLILFLYQRGLIGYTSHVGTKTGTFFNDDPGHDINEKFHYVIRPTYVSKMSIK